MDELLTRTYKRSQVEQVIGMLDFRLYYGRIDPVLRSRLKRLLDADRGSVSDDDVRAGRRLAFVDGVKPGPGSEIGYTAYQAFALLLGVRLLQGGITEGRTVALLQRTRPALEGAFKRIAGVSRRELQEWIWSTVNPDAPNQKDLTAIEAEERVRNGVIVGNPAKMTFFIEVAGSGGADDLSSAETETANICDARQLLERLRYFSHVGRAAVIIELTNAEHQLLYWLPHTTVRKRGRQ